MIACYHVVSADDCWLVRREGCTREISRHEAVELAIQAGERLARENGCLLVVHDRAGWVLQRRDFRVTRTTPARAA